jgi:hypothetical protein
VTTGVIETLEKQYLRHGLIQILARARALQGCQGATEGAINNVDGSFMSLCSTLIVSTFEESWFPRSCFDVMQ